MRKGKNTGRTMDPDMPVLRPSIPPTPAGPSWRGRRSRGGGWGGLMPTMDEFFGTSTQVCGGFWPFSTDMALPVEGVPIGRSMTTGAGVCCDPISWFRAGIIEQPSMFVMGLPAIGKSTFVRRQVWGMSALGMNAIIHDALKRLTGDAREDLLADYHERRSALMEVLLTISRTGREEGRRTVSDVESNVLSTALKILYERTKDDPEPPVIPDLRDLVRQGTPEIRAAAVFDDPENDEAYARSTRDLLSSLHGLANPMGRFGRLFCEQTTERLDLSRPVDFDISALAQAGDDVVAAVLAATWSSAFAAKNAADMMAEAGLQPRRNHVIIMDEMHRALRASPLMVDRLDLLTRLNRQWGVGQIMITHTFADLLCLDTQAQNNKARGFVERSKIKVLGALSRTEIKRYLRGESGLPISVREEDMLADWATPTNFDANASFKGVGKFLVKLGGLPGIPVNVQMCDIERSGFNDTNAKWSR